MNRLDDEMSETQQQPERPKKVKPKHRSGAGADFVKVKDKSTPDPPVRWTGHPHFSWREKLTK
jgi:hypothetical protein